MNPLDILPPSVEELIADLKEVRRSGVARLGRLELPGLVQAVKTSGRAIDDSAAVSSFVVERLLRDAVVRIGGDLGDATVVLFGLDEGGRSSSPAHLRDSAAEVLIVSREHFRKGKEPFIFEQIANLILEEVYSHRLRLARLRADVRTPVGSRLAVEWLRRFEGMYKIFSPLTGVAGDLTAYRGTLLQPPEVWHRDPDPNDPEDKGYNNRFQAAGYVAAAFAFFCEALCCEKGYQTQHGGMWLLTDAQAEEDLATAIHSVRQATPHNSRYDSYMRIFMEKAGREQHQFLKMLENDAVAMETLEEWQDWVSTCECVWELGDRKGRELFPDHRNHPKIDAQCDMYILIAAINDYCLILNDGWDAIADWYRDVPRPERQNSTAEEMYAERENARFRSEGV